MLVPRRICKTTDANDPSNDVGTLDITSYSAALDCANRNWILYADTRDTWALSKLGAFEAWVNIDGNNTNGCLGADRLLLVQYSASLHTWTAGAYVANANCDGAGGLTHRLTPLTALSAVGHAGGGAANDVGVLVPEWVLGTRIRSFTWHASLLASGGAWDRTSWTWIHGYPLPTTFFRPLASEQVNGQYTQVVGGDFDGDGYGDLLFYRAGPGADSIWWGDGRGRFAKQRISINGSYRLIIGDFNGDGRRDVLFYGPGSTPESIWWGASSRHFVATRAHAISGTYAITAGDFNGDGRTDLYFAHGHDNVFWVNTTSVGTSTFAFTQLRDTIINRSFTSIAPVDYDCDGADDLLFYASGPSPDAFTFPDHGLLSNALKVAPNGHGIDGTYVAVSGRFEGGCGDVLLYGPGSLPDALLQGSGFGPTPPGHSQLVTVAGPAIHGVYVPVVFDADGDGRADIFFYGGPSGAESILLGT